jgi:hypothetical protein
MKILYNVEGGDLIRIDLDKKCNYGGCICKNEKKEIINEEAYYDVHYIVISPYHPQLAIVIKIHDNYVIYMSSDHIKQVIK